MALLAVPVAGTAPAWAQDAGQNAADASAQSVTDAAATDAAAAQAEAGAPAGGEAPPQRFTIRALDVYGVESLPRGVVEEIVYRFTGPDKSPADVEAARAAIEKAYADRGFAGAVAYIPVQDTAAFEQGVVRIDVTETKIGAVQVASAREEGGEIGGSPDLVRRQFPSLAAGAAFRQDSLERELAAANRFPGRVINVVPKPGAQPGTIDVDLLVEEDNPLSASLELNNDNSVDTTRLRAAGNVRYANLWGRGHSLSLGFVVAPEDPSESTAITGSYTLPFLGSRWSLSLIGFYSDSNVVSGGVTATGSGPNVLSDGFQVGLRAIYNIPTRGTTFRTLSFGVDYKDFAQVIRQGDTLLQSAPINYLPLEVQYALAGGSGNSIYDVSVGVTYGIRLIGDNTVCGISTGTPIPGTVCEELQERAPFSRENFVRLNVGGNLSRTFAGDFKALVGLSGQWADSTLVSNEQYAIGGANSVRGYYLSEAVGDLGVQGSLEVQSPSLGRVFGDFVDNLRLVAFADTGYVYTLDTGPEQDNDSYLLGVGGGVRLGLFDLLTGEAMLGFPLIEGPNTSIGDPRFTFVVRGEF
jgi:hemolysin activation/secretion protein